jgi:2-deoxy-D-gluconate 3-dehydrogenase
MAIGLAEAGADIVSLDRNGSEQTGQIVSGLSRRFKEVCCDLRQAAVADLQQIVAQVVADLGQLDVLVNNAGIIRRAPALEFSEADWDDVLHINLKAAFFLLQAAARV